MNQAVPQSQAAARGFGVLREIIKAMRPKDWLKNAFVFAAIVFSKDQLWKEPIPLLKVFGAFVLFSMVAGAIYLINDLVDIEKDRAHPKKRNRPLASGRLSPRAALVAVLVLLGVALPGGFWLDHAPGATWFQNLDFGISLLAYILIQGVLYSYYLKNIVLLDIFTIAAGFVLRAVAGALVLNIQITPWLLLCMGLLALFLGLAKRRAEIVLLQDGAGEHRRILQEYSLPLLDQLIGIVIAATIMAYSLFTITAETLPLKPFPLLMVTIPFVIYAIFRYLYLIYKHDGGGNPAEMLLSDRPLAICILGWGALALVILALPR